MTRPATTIKLAADATGTDVSFLTSTGPVVAQATVPVDDTGHIRGTTPTYSLFVPPSAAGANKVYFDLFNATGSGKTLRVRSVRALKDGSVAVTGVVSVRLFLTRTTSVGTGGTAATVEGTSLTAPAMCKRNLADPPLPAQVTARAVPTGGAAAGAVLAQRDIFPEETNASTYDAPEFVTRAAEDVQPISVPENTGIRIVQGAVASVGNIGFEVIFEAP